jgi:ATP diphosphatase
MSSATRLRSRQGNAAPPGMETSGIDAKQVLRNWEQIKRAEKVEMPQTPLRRRLLDSVPRSFPALMEAAKLGSKAAKAGFDWPDAEGVFDKLEEEIAELREAIQQRNGQHSGEIREAQDKSAVAEELGDLLFTAVNLAPRSASIRSWPCVGRTGNSGGSFAAMEKSSIAALEEQSPEQLEALWNQAKRAKPPLLRRRPDDRSA